MLGGTKRSGETGRHSPTPMRSGHRLGGLHYYFKMNWQSASARKNSFCKILIVTSISIVVVEVVVVVLFNIFVKP